jgi:hypothetical protein
MTFGEAVIDKIRSLRNKSSAQKQEMERQWLAADPNTLSNAKARRVADSILGQRNSVSLGWVYMMISQDSACANFLSLSFIIGTDLL